MDWGVFDGSNMSSAELPNGLTVKQEAFACIFFECGNAAEAYRQAYDVDESARDEWIYVEASQLVDHPKVARRLIELSEQAASLSIYTRHKAMEELEEARVLAIKAVQPAGAVSATNAKVKLVGLDRPKRIDLSSSDGTMTPKPVANLTRLSDKELKQLERLTDKATDTDGMGTA